MITVSEDRIVLRDMMVEVGFDVSVDMWSIDMWEDHRDGIEICVDKEEWREFVIGMIELMNEEDREEILRRVWG